MVETSFDTAAAAIDVIDAFANEEWIWGGITAVSAVAVFAAANYSSTAAAEADAAKKAADKGQQQVSDLAHQVRRGGPVKGVWIGGKSFKSLKFAAHAAQKGAITAEQLGELREAAKVIENVVTTWSSLSMDALDVIQEFLQTPVNVKVKRIY